MSLIARLVGAAAPQHAVHTAEKAEAAGFENVQTTYRPQTRAFEVSGDLPDAEPQRTIDRILGR
jgi:hypothetical protein